MERYTQNISPKNENIVSLTFPAFPRRWTDCQGFARMHSGMRFGIHFVHHLRGQRALLSGEAENDQRRRHPGRHGRAGIRELRRTVDRLSSQIPRNDQIGATDLEQRR